VLLVFKVLLDELDQLVSQEELELQDQEVLLEIGVPLE
jgi:hypothetical protein